MKKVLPRLGLAVMILLAPLALEAATWKIDPDHSSVQFQIRHLNIANVRGSFEKFQGTVRLDEEDITKSTAEIAIEVASVNTGVAKRDEHLRSPDFFDVAKYPTMTFVARKVVQTGKDQLKLTGDLTLRGVTKEVVLNVSGPTPQVKDPWGNVRRGAAATTTIDRRDFGLTWHKALDTGEPLVGNQVGISLELELIKNP